MVPAVVSGLLVFSRPDLRADWNSHVLSIDASLSGYCVTGKQCSRSEIHDIGCWGERCRFKIVREQKPRDAVGLEGSHELSDVLTVLETREPPELETAFDLSFPEVPSRPLRMLSLWNCGVSPFGQVMQYFSRRRTQSSQPLSTSAEIVHVMVIVV